MKKRWCALVLAAVAVIGGVWLRQQRSGQTGEAKERFDVSAETVSAWDNVIAYIPLDDRTDNIDSMIYMAEASGYRVVMPPKTAYSTKLDGQVLNDNGTQYGDREALFRWVREMDEKGCDRFILSLDQLFSGGLVNSRAMAEDQQLTFADGTRMTEAEAFDDYILRLHEDAENRVYLFDSVVRLASTVGYQGFDLAEYNALRSYGMAPRRQLAESDLTMDAIFAAYPYGEDGKTPAQQTVESAEERTLLENEDILRGYLGVRQRKLQLTDHVVTAVKALNSERFTLLVGIDDSSNSSNIQTNELHYIQSILGERMDLMAGLDSLPRILLGLIAQEEYGASIRAAVTYVGGTEEIPSSEYELYTVRQTVDLHMELYHIERTERKDAELEFVIMTRPDSEEKKTQYCDELLALLKENEKNRVPTVLIETSNNTYGELLEKRLQEEIEISRLVAFCGKYDQAVVTGVGFAMGVTRYLYLQYCPTPSAECDAAHVQQLAHSLALTLYIVHARYDLNVFIRDLGYNYNNILAEGKDAAAIQKKLAQVCEPVQRDTERCFKNCTVLSDLRDGSERKVASVTLGKTYLPWNRTFEAAMPISVAFAK